MANDEEPAFVAVFPDNDPKDPGWRLHLRREPDEMAMLIEERVLPEKVDDPNARRVLDKTWQTWLKRRDAVWMHEQLGKLLADWPQDADETMKLALTYDELDAIIAADGRGWLETDGVIAIFNALKERGLCRGEHPPMPDLFK